MRLKWHSGVQANNGHHLFSLDLDAHTDRAKRDIQPKKAEEENGYRTENFIVHSKDLGLSTKFIRPESFNSYHCKGKCSLTSWQKGCQSLAAQSVFEKDKGRENRW